MKFSKINEIWQFSKEQGCLYQLTVALIFMIFISIFFFGDDNKTPLLMLLLSLVLMVITLTANLIKGEHKLKSEISNYGIALITIFFLISLCYLTLSISNKEIINWESLKNLFNLDYWLNWDNWSTIITSMSELFFIIAVFLMSNLFNFIKPKKDK